MVMRSEKIKVEPLSFAFVMKAMAEGQFRIPRFQRTFVWERSRIQNLLDSMYQEYPIGTIFLWKAPSEYNHMIRSVEYLGQPALEDHRPYTFILDGQQRLTSLYVTINGLQIKGENYGKIVVDLANTEVSKFFQYRQPDNRRWVSVRDLVANDVFTLYESLPAEYRQRFQDIRQRLTTYPFSVVSVSQMNLDDAIEIFERINQQSKRLTRYDLIAATVLTDEFDLRERSKRDIIDPHKSTFGDIQETNVPQALSLNIRNSTEHSTQMSLTSAEVRQVWLRTVDCFRLAVDYVKSNLGVKRSDFLPYSAILPVLAYYFYYGKSDVVKSSFHREQIEKWFWRTAFAERYSGASQTRMTEDAEQIRKLIDSETPFDFDRMPVTLDEKALIQASMQSSTSAVRNGILCMLALRRPVHPLNRAEVNLDDAWFNQFTRAERHHVFSPDIIEAHAQIASKRAVHRIPNFCFFTEDISMEIGKSSPSAYFGQLRERYDEHELTQILRTHLLPGDSESGIWSDNYKVFLNQRAHLMVVEIRKLCGLTLRVAEEYRSPLIDEVEIAIRDLIHTVLSAQHGLDYFKRAIPDDVRTHVEERIEKQIANVPGTSKSQFNNPRLRLDHVDVADYQRIIPSSQNWSNFSRFFRSKPDFERYANDFRLYRNAIKHNQAIDTLLEMRGQTAILWFSRALELDLSEYGVI